jgi:hypothetical protein
MMKTETGADAKGLNPCGALEEGWTKMMTAVTFILPGLLCLAAFLYLNLALQPKWFPREVAGASAAAQEPAPGPVGHFMLGLILMALMFFGIFMIIMGCVEYGILNSRG